MPPSAERIIEMADKNAILKMFTNEVIKQEKECNERLDVLIKAYEDGVNTAKGLKKTEHRVEDTLCWFTGHIFDLAELTRQYNLEASILYRLKETLDTVK
jgi:hypothetical protein